MEQRFVIEDQVAGFFIGQELDQAFRCPDFATQHRKNKLDVLRCKLGPAIRLNEFHRFLWRTLR